MGVYAYLQRIWKRPKTQLADYREMLVSLRREPVSVRLARPTRLDRARRLGYRAKQGVLVVRQRVARGGRTRARPAGGRRSRHFSGKLVLGKNYQQVAEERAARRYPNCEVLNSYLLARDGKHSWYEVILVDRDHPVVRSDPVLRGIADQRGRAVRGRTSAGRRSRGLRGKGRGYEKVRGV